MPNLADKCIAMIEKEKETLPAHWPRLKERWERDIKGTYAYFLTQEERDRLIAILSIPLHAEGNQE